MYHSQHVVNALVHVVPTIARVRKITRLVEMIAGAHLISVRIERRDQIFLILTSLHHHRQRNLDQMVLLYLPQHQIIIMQTVLIPMAVDLIERIPPLTKSRRTHQSYVHFTININAVPMMEISSIAANARHMYIVLAMKNIEQL